MSILKIRMRQVAVTHLHKKSQRLEMSTPISHEATECILLTARLRQRELAVPDA